MAKFNHAFTIAFSIVSDADDGSDISPEIFEKVIIERAKSLYREEQLIEAIGAPFDTYEEPENDT